MVPTSEQGELQYGDPEGWLRQSWAAFLPPASAAALPVTLPGIWQAIWQRVQCRVPRCKDIGSFRENVYRRASSTAGVQISGSSNSGQPGSFPSTSLSNGGGAGGGYSGGSGNGYGNGGGTNSYYNNGNSNNNGNSGYNYDRYGGCVQI